MKRFLPSLLALATMFAPSATIWPPSAVAQTTNNSSDSSISILLDGWTLPTTPQPVIYQNRTMVPFRSIADALGVPVNWDATTRTVIAESNGKEIRLQIGNKTAQVNGQPVALDAEPIISHDYTLIPLRFLAESIGATVNWDATNQRVLIQSQPRHVQTTVFYGLGSYDERFYVPKFDNAVFTWSELDANGHLVFDQPDYQWPTSGADQLLSEVKAANVNTELMVYGNDDKGVLSKMLQDDALQTQFINDLVAKLNEQGMNEAVLDLEDLGPSIQGVDLNQIQTQYAAFVQKVADALHAQNKKLMVCVSPLNGWYKGYDYVKLAKAADQLYIMAYGYGSAQDTAPIDVVDAGLQMAVKEVDPSKLVLGINLYGEDDASLLDLVGLSKRYDLGGVGFWILKMMGDQDVKALDSSLILRTNTLQEPPPTDGTSTEGSATNSSGGSGSMSNTPQAQN